MIKSITELDAFIASDAGAASPFAAMSDDDMSFFKTMLVFTNDGRVAGFWGDVAKASSFDDDQMANFVAETFGVDAKVFKASYHKFGDAQGNCTPRPYFSCPY